MKPAPIECDKNPLESGVIMNYDPEIEIVCQIVGLDSNLSDRWYNRSRSNTMRDIMVQLLKQNLFINQDFINVNGTSIFLCRERYVAYVSVMILF